MTAIRYTTHTRYDTNSGQMWLGCKHRSEGCTFLHSNCCGAQTIPPLLHTWNHIASSDSLNSKTELLNLHVEVLGLHRVHKESFVTWADYAVQGMKLNSCAMQAFLTEDRAMSIRNAIRKLWVVTHQACVSIVYKSMCSHPQALV